MTERLLDEYYIIAKNKNTIMKKLKHLFTALLLLCSLTAKAHDFEVGGIYYNILSEDGNTVEVTYRGTSDSQYSNEYYNSVVIPESVIYNGSTYSVTSIGNKAFCGCYLLSNIEIPNIVTSIGNYAFYDCTGLTSIEIPNSVTSIGNNAFEWCSGLTSIIVAPDNTKYDSRGNCNAIIETETNVLIKGCINTVIPACVTSIGDYAFSRCWLTNIVIPNSITSIGNNAFMDCCYLANIEIPNSVTSIGNDAFEYCTSLTSIEIPGSVKSIGNAAFYGCTGLTSVVIGNGVTNIDYHAFSYCTSLTSIVIPKSVTNIGNHAFDGCTSLKDLRIEDGESILFLGCNYDKGLFYDCPLETLYLGRDLDYNNTDSYNGPSPFMDIETLQSIVVGNSVTSIGNIAFAGCSGLTSIEIPNSVTSIGRYAFWYCSALTSIEIPNNVTSIERYTFYNCDGLTSVVIPNNVTSIGESAFYWCDGLTSVTIGNSVTSIGERAFCNCTGLTSITIPNSVISIGEQAFYICTGLTSITIPNSVTSIGNKAFENCTGLTSVVVDGNNTKYDSRENCNAIIETETNTLILGCKNTVIPNSVTSIGGWAFSGCSGLTSVVIPNSVTSIGWAAFSDCSGLTSVVIPNSVTSIGDYAFSDCSNLASVTVESEMPPTIYNETFYNVNNSTCTLYVPYGAKDAYASTNGWSEFTNIVELEKPITEVTVTIDQYGCATYCSPFALDFSNVEGLKAYSAIGFNSSTQVVTLATVMTTPAGAGIFVKGEPGEYIVPVIEQCNDHTLNLLVGTLAQTTVDSTSGEMSNYMFTFDDNSNAPMFCQFEDNTTFAAGKAYLKIPTAWLPLIAQKSLNIHFEESEMTEIKEVKTESEETNCIYYDLNGRKVVTPKKGLYIINGKKVFIK